MRGANVLLYVKRDSTKIRRGKSLVSVDFDTRDGEGWRCNFPPI